MRLGFDTGRPTAKLADRHHFWFPLLTLPTLGLIIPYAQHQQYRWLVGRFAPAVGRFYRAWLAALLILMSMILYGVAIHLWRRLDDRLRRPRNRELPMNSERNGRSRFLFRL